MLSDTLQILILIFCSIDMDNLDRELLVQPSEILLLNFISCRGGWIGHMRQYMKL